MEIIFWIGALLLIICWIGFLVPVYAAWKNKRYKTVAICLSSIALSIATAIGMVVYDYFATVASQGKLGVPTDSVDEIVLSILGFVLVVSHFFSLWYIYCRKSWDFMYIDGHTADEIATIISPECKKLLGLH
ncbi:MAG: hypothetical protein VZR95_06000 [Alphaproteobacteria bacterium]